MGKVVGLDDLLGRRTRGLAQATSGEVEVTSLASSSSLSSGGARLHDG